MTIFCRIICLLSPSEILFKTIEVDTTRNRERYPSRECCSMIEEVLLNPPLSDKGKGL